MIIKKPFICNPGEILKPIIGYEGLYEVSNLGRVKNLKDNTEVDYYIHNGSNYIRCSLKDANGKRRYWRVSILTADAFIPNPNNLPEVDHINEDKNDNSVSNLRRVTHKQNMQNYYKNHKGEFQKAKPIRCIETDTIYDSIREASRKITYIDKKTGELKHGINKNRLQETLNGGQKTAAGYHWEYVEK